MPLCNRIYTHRIIITHFVGGLSDTIHWRKLKPIKWAHYESCPQLPLTTISRPVITTVQGESRRTLSDMSQRGTLTLRSQCLMKWTVLRASTACYATSRAPRRSLEGILVRLTGCVGYLSVTCSCALLGAPDFLSFLLSPELLILTLLPLPFAWHLLIDKKGVLFSTEVVKKRMPRSQLGVNIQCLARYTTAVPLQDSSIFGFGEWERRSEVYP
jgi:hypothetical protein